MSRLLAINSPFDPNHRFQTSWVLSPLLYGCVRLLFSVYIFQYLVYRIAYSAVNDGGVSARKSFSYFTNITYWGLGFYFAFAGFHTVVYALRGTAPLQRWPKALQFLHALFYSSIVTFSFLVTIVYWGILAETDFPFRTAVSGYSNVSGHLLNSVFALFEIVFARTERPPWIHLLFLVLFLAGYLAVAYITYAVQGFYAYDFLDPATGNGRVTAYCFGIVAAICIVFIVAWLLIWARLVVVEKVLGAHGKFSRRDRGGSVEWKGGVEGQGVEVSKV